MKSKIFWSWLVSTLLLMGVGSLAQAPTFQVPLEVAEGGISCDFEAGEILCDDAVLDPWVAVDGSDHVYVAWSDRAAKEIMLRKSTDGGKTLLDPINVSNTPDESIEPQIAIDSKNKIYVLWQENVGGTNRELFLSSSTDGGQSFSPSVNVTNNPGASGRHSLGFGEQILNDSFSITTDKADGVLIVWTDNEDMLLFSKSTDGGQTFSAPVELPKGKGLPRAPDVAVDKDGTIWVAWANGAGESGDVSLIKSTDGGQTWSERLNITDNEGFSDAPNIAVDAEGNITIVFNDDTPELAGPHAAIIAFVRSTDGGKTFSAPQTISTPIGGGFPAMAQDPKGNLFVSFSAISGRRSGGAGFTFSLDKGQSFAPAIELAGTALASVTPTRDVSIAVDSKGNIYIASSRAIRGQATQILLSVGRFVASPELGI